MCILKWAFPSINVLLATLMFWSVFASWYYQQEVEEEEEEEETEEESDEELEEETEVNGLSAIRLFVWSAAFLFILRSWSC